MQRIEFVGYDGAYPNLCSGNLLMKIDGRIVGFTNCLESGGRAYFTNGYADEHVEHGRWKFHIPLMDDYENRVDFYTDYAKCVVPPIYLSDEDCLYIEMLVNENVPHGCCGGCL